MSYIVEKPWGSEEILYQENDITVKILRSFKGSLSLQIHPYKDEIFTILDYDKDIIKMPYIKFSKPKDFNQCISGELSTIYVGIGSQVECPHGMVHIIPQGLTVLEYSKGKDITLRIEDYYGRGNDLEEIRKLFE